MLLRAVVDVNVLVSAGIGREGPPAQIVRACLEGAFEIVVSPALLAELDRVLAYPRVAERCDAADVGQLRDALDRAAVHVDDPPTQQHIPADPADDYLVTLAIAAGAHVIVSGDRHLLDAPLGEGAPQVLGPAAFVALVGALPE